MRSDVKHLAEPGLIRVGTNHSLLSEQRNEQSFSKICPELVGKSAVRSPAARFFIDVCGVSERVLRKSVRKAADASRCPSTPDLV